MSGKGKGKQQGQQQAQKGNKRGERRADEDEDDEKPQAQAQTQAKPGKKEPPKKPEKEKVEQEASGTDEDGSNDSPRKEKADAGTGTDGKGTATGPPSKQEQRKLAKLRKEGKITREEYDRLMGNDVQEEPNDEEKRKILKAEEYESGLQGYKQKRGELDTMSRDVKVEQFTLAYKGQTLLKDADLSITHGRKYGLIGPNGSGKSTLLRHISQRHIPIPEHIQMLHVEQEVEGSDTPAIKAVLEADTERTALFEEEKTLKPIASSEQDSDEARAAQERLIEVYKRLKSIGAYSAEARAAGILAGLAFTPEMQQKATKEFSGGWRMRIALARALFVQPTLLILDEPTNHLDLDAVIWLEAYLKKYKKTLLLVSHDRDFLNGIVTDILDLRELKIFHYKGNYDAFERGLQQKMREYEKQYKKEQKALVEAQEKQGKSKASKDVKEKIQKQGGPMKKVGKEYTVELSFPNPPELAPPIVQIKNASFGYLPGEENLIFKNLELNIGNRSKIGIVGPNGTGKSTLMNLILGALEPTGGEIIRNRKLRTAKFFQHAVDQLNMNDNPINYIHGLFPELKEQDIRNKLGGFGLKGKQNHEKAIALLSGGQKSRVMFLEMALREPHIMFMDEPTNHLDIQAVDGLAQALLDFEGGLVLITHDQRLVSRVCDELWVCRGIIDKTVEIYDGTFDDYKQEIIDEMPDEWFLDDKDD